MKKVQVTIERGGDGKFTAYTTDRFQEFGLLGYGDSAADTIADFLSAYEEVKEMKGGLVPELSFVFRYDTASFLNHYSEIFSKPILEKITGVSQKQLWHYASGLKKPRPETVLKIEHNLHKFADEMKQVHLC
jgi:hypothetical protein